MILRLGEARIICVYRWHVETLISVLTPNFPRPISLKFAQRNVTSISTTTAEDLEFF